MAEQPPSRALAGARLVLGMVGIMWAVEVVDLVTGPSLDAFGIRPRDLGGIMGVAAAPFLHAGFGHLLANTVPLVILGLVIAIGGALRVASVTAITALVSGLGVWLIAPSATVTVGASGLVFGYAAYLIARGIVARNPLHLAVGVLVVAVLGTGLLAGLVPRTGISWQAHLFGAIGGVVAARMLHRREPKRMLDTPGPPPAPRLP